MPVQLPLCMRGTPSSGDDKAICPYVLQSELTSAPFNHTMAPQDDFLVVGHLAQSLSEALSRRSVPLPELKRRVTRAMEVFHHPLGCHTVDLTTSLHPLSRRKMYDIFPKHSGGWHMNTAIPSRRYRSRLPTSLDSGTRAWSTPKKRRNGLQVSSEHGARNATYLVNNE